MKIPTVFRSRAFMIIVLSVACAALSIVWPQWRDDLRAEGYYGYGYFDLPDTGQTTCYDTDGSVIDCAGTGQDGAYDINPLSYTDNQDGTVTDNNTGLMWQQDENPTTYNWYQASGTYDATYNSTSQNVCGELTIDGYSDWRLPTKKELLSIVDYSIPYPGPTIKTDYFPGANTDFYWSSTTSASDPDGAWSVAFYLGFVSYDYFGNKDGDGYVRCVRGGEMDFGNFVDNHDGTITDSSTGLMWQQGEPGTMTWSAALDYCENLELPSGSGQTDWRMPDIKELESITDDTVYNPAIDRNFFPNADFGNYAYWSSTTEAGSPYTAWIVEFGYGYVWYGYKENGNVRCVRGPEKAFDYYCDDDSDGYIDSQIDGTCLGDGCVPQGCQITPGDDCNDSVSAINPGAAEICDGIDNNCDGQIDEGVINTFYWDSDTDSYGDPLNTTESCTAPSGYVADNTDCDDSNAEVNPGATEICDGVDNNCDGQIDEGCSFTLTVTKTGTGSGTVTSNPAGISCGVDCSEAYDSDTVVILTAVPDTGSIFTGVSGDSDCSDGSVTMNADKSCTATFKKVKFEENDPAITYARTWNNYTCAACSGGGVKYSGQSGAKASLTFTGTGIKWIAAKSNQLGKAKVYIDNVLQTTVDLYSSMTKTKQVVYQKTGLTNSSHTIRIEFTGTKNFSSKGNAIDIDAFEVMP